MEEEILQTVRDLQQKVSDLENQILNDKQSLTNRIDVVDNKIGNRDYLPPHQHKIDRIATKDLIGGFPVVSSTPTEVAEEGIIKIYDNGSTRRLYVKANQTWRYIDLN